MRLTTLTAALALLATGATAQLSITEYGVFCDVDLADQRPAPGTESGVLNLIDGGRPFDLQTARVPAELGLSFGVRIALDNDAEPQTLLVTVTHPPIGARQVSVEQWTLSLAPGAETISMFTFEHDYERVQGIWRFTIQDETGAAVEQSFAVTGLTGAPEVQDVCFPGLMTS